MDQESFDCLIGYVASIIDKKTKYLFYARIFLNFNLWDHCELNLLVRFY